MGFGKNDYSQPCACILQAVELNKKEEEKLGPLVRTLCVHFKTVVDFQFVTN